MIALRAGYAARGALKAYQTASRRAALLRSRSTVAPLTPNENPFQRTGRKGILTDAIEYRQEVAFWYSNEDSTQDGRRRGNPHAIIKIKGRTYLLMWTLIGSASESRRLPGWRMFILQRIRNPQIIIKARIGADLQQFRIAPGYKRWRRGRFIARVQQ
jgi:hypothetical protein